MSTRKDAMKAAVTAALAIAEDVTAGQLDVTTLDALALEECRGLFSRVVGPGDVLWDLHVEVARQVLAVGGGVPVDELAEWVAVYRAAEAEAAAELAAAVPADRGPSWIETALADVDDETAGEVVSQI